RKRRPHESTARRCTPGWDKRSKRCRGNSGTPCSSMRSPTSATRKSHSLLTSRLGRYALGSTEPARSRKAYSRLRRKAPSSQHQDTTSMDDLDLLREHIPEPLAPSDHAKRRASARLAQAMADEVRRGTPSQPHRTLGAGVLRLIRTRPRSSALALGT